jgi:small subunit ribosomal protein S10e
MFMPKKNRIAIYAAVYADGVMTCQKDVKLEKHHIMNIPNLHVVNALLSLKSKGHVREVFSWQWHYFFLTETGVVYLREYLHLPEDVVPATLKKSAPKSLGLGDGGAQGPAGRFGNREGGGERGRFGDKGGAPGAGGGFRPRFDGERAGAGGERGGYQRGPGGFAGSPRS